MRLDDPDADPVIQGSTAVLLVVQGLTANLGSEVDLKRLGSCKEVLQQGAPNFKYPSIRRAEMCTISHSMFSFRAMGLGMQPVCHRCHVPHSENGELDFQIPSGETEVTDVLISPVSFFHDLMRILCAVESTWVYITKVGVLDWVIPAFATFEVLSAGFTPYHKGQRLPLGMVLQETSKR